MCAVSELFDRIVDKNLLVRRMYVVAKMCIRDRYFIVIDRDFIYEIGVLYLSIAAQAMIASLENRFQEE